MVPTDRPPAGAPEPAPSPVQPGRAPAWAVRSSVVGAAVVIGALVIWLVVQALLALAVVTMAVAAAVLLSALVAPAARRLRRAGAPGWLAALACALLLVLVLTGVGTLLWFRTSARLGNLAPAVTVGIERVRTWLVEGPLALDPVRVDGLADRLATQVVTAVPGPVAGARLAMSVLAGVFLVLFLVFFFVKDGDGMWRWFLVRVPQRRRDRVDGAGRRAWTTLNAYALGVVTVAAVDAVLIGAGLLVVGVPLWLSLMLLTFLGAFVPYFGALISGAVAVLVTLVTEGPGDAVVILVLVLLVQQLEGNVLHPLIMRRAVHLHPVVVLLAVTCGTLLLGIPGAVVAVPLVAVTHAVLEHLRETSSVDQRATAVDQRATPSAAAPSGR